MQAEFTLVVTAQELAVISNALGLRPYIEVAAVVAKLQAQITEQDAASKKTDAS